MKCKKIQEYLSSYIDGQLPPKFKERIQNHLNTCTECNRRMGEIKSTISLIKSLGEQPLPQYYTTQLEAKLDENAPRETYVPDNHTSLWLRFKWQVILSVFILGIFAGSGVLYVSQVLNKRPKETPRTIGLGETGFLSFNLFSKSNVKSIVFYVELPEGISLVSNPKERSLQWEGNLIQGENVIYLYVKGIEKGTWSINTKLQMDGQLLKEFQMPLLVTDKKG